MVQVTFRSKLGAMVRLGSALPHSKARIGCIGCRLGHYSVMLLPSLGGARGGCDSVS